MTLYHNLAENELLALVKNGDQAAFEVCYRKFRPQIHRYAIHITKSVEATEEIIHYPKLMDSYDKKTNGRW